MTGLVWFTLGVVAGGSVLVVGFILGCLAWDRSQARKATS